MILLPFAPSVQAADCVEVGSLTWEVKTDDAGLRDKDNTGWSGACTGVAPTCTVSMTAARNVIATFTVTPNTGYTATVTGCGGTLAGATYTTGPITGDCAVNASFALKTYTVAATGGANGSISPASRTVAHGATTTFTVTPSANYVATVTGCGGTLSGNTYTYTICARAIACALSVERGSDCAGNDESIAAMALFEQWQT